MFFVLLISVLFFKLTVTSYPLGLSIFIGERAKPARRYLVMFMETRDIIGERAKRARHSHVCSIENHGYIYILCIVRAKFCSYNP